MNAWESVFMQSRVNDGYYDEEGLPDQAWPWPKETWFQGRLDKVREQEPTALLNPGKKSRLRTRRSGNHRRIDSLQGDRTVASMPVA